MTPSARIAEAESVVREQRAGDADLRALPLLRELERLQRAVMGEA